MKRETKNGLTKPDSFRRAAWNALPTRKQRIFVDEYCVDLDTRRAAIVASLSYGQARNLMMEQRMKAAINETLHLRSEQAGVKAEDILRDLRIVADKCMGRIPVTKVVKVKKQKGTKVIEVEEVREDSIWDAAGANAALLNLGRHKKLFTDVVESRSHEEALEVLLSDTNKLGYRVKFVGGLPVLIQEPATRTDSKRPAG